MSGVQTVTARVVRKVKPGLAPAVEAKVAEILALAVDAPGYRGASVTKTGGPDNTVLTTLLHFDSKAQLADWRKSDAARRAIDDAATQIEEMAQVELVEGDIGWFEVPAPVSAAGGHHPPPKWKMAIVTWLAIFPVLTLVIAASGPYLANLHLVARLFINTIIIAPLMTWLVMPLMTRLFAPWLFGAKVTP